MIKTAIFVEGQTELIFVRELLLKMFDYDNIWIQCFNLFSASGESMKATNYTFPDPKAVPIPNAGFYFQIMNVGGDNNVLSRLRKREERLWNEGYHKIVGLRDMYSKEYKEAAKGKGQIIPEINQKFIEGHSRQIQLGCKKPAHIHFHFAIMEVEAWMLGMVDIFGKMDPKMSLKNIKDKLNIDLVASDPETEFLHPNSVLQSIFQLANKNYRKQAGEVETILGNTQKDDFELLNMGEKCESFSAFFRSLNLEQN